MATYFVDSKNGNNSFDGLSQEKAFKNFEKLNVMTLSAGDKILLKRDSVFTDHLIVEGSGSVDEPIVISSYGVGHKKPAIITEDGAHSSVAIYGDCVTVDGVEVSNPKGHAGILFESKKHGANYNVTVTGCYVHDVWTINDLPPREQGAAGWQHHYGGIIFETNMEAPTWYENLRIENNTVINVNRTGIWVCGKWQDRFKNTLNWMKNDAPGMDDPWYPHKNMYVAWNVVDHAYGDGIVITSGVNVLVEHNRVYYANYMSRKGASNVALWTMNCDDAIVQYNEAAYTGKDFGGDGEGYDIDQNNRRNIYQYNYSHHNAGGFLLVCNGCNCKDSVRDCIVRNNLSVNDGIERDIPIFTISGPMNYISFVNNTIYTENKQLYKLFYVTDFLRIGLPSNLLFANNIFYSKYKVARNAFEMSGPITFDSNIFYNMPKLPERENIIDKGNYYDLNPAWQSEGYTPGNRIDAGGFVPLWDSPLIRMGKHYDVCADKDYNGLDAKGHNYIGAFYYKDANLG
ncbi:MAG: hypothetical protein UHE86_05775 [Acutalibacteraceae bacterium]|nr:hypothetical protein [Clostridia bacterium]MEE1278550.1 hypothetical protein [Acutalibacteraceae bacterium]